MGTGDDYVLGRTEAEYRRLRAQAQIWEATTRRVLGEAGLGPGMRCLDAGCGPGEAMRLIGRIVGPEGHVTGIDLDAELGRHMLATLHREEGPNFAFLAQDISAGGAVAGAPFDFVLARLLLLHLSDPVAAIRNLAAQLRPGGRLLLMDFDLTRLTSRPEHPALARAFEIMVACFGRPGHHADTGLLLAGWIAEAGLPQPRGDAATFYASIAERGPLIRAVLASLGPAAAGLGVADSDEIAALQEQIVAIEAANDHFGLGPLMISAWTTA